MTIDTTGPASPITVTGLTNGETYRSRVYARGPGGVSAPSSWSSPFTPSSTSGGFVRPYLTSADWLWDPIPANPTLASNSAAIVAQFNDSNGNTNKLPLVYNFGFSIYEPPLPAFTRQTVTIAQDVWGDGPWGSALTNTPIPNSVLIPPPGVADYGDSHVTVVDTANGNIDAWWRFRTKSGGGYEASTGSRHSISGDGRGGEGTTYIKVPAIGFVVTGAEMQAVADGDVNAIKHALFFSTNRIGGVGLFPSPALTRSYSGFSDPLRPGHRIQLNPSYDVSQIANLAQRAIARALQTYGAYCGDGGGSRLAMAFQLLPGSTANSLPAPYSSVGLTVSGGWGGHFTQIPWSQLRVLNSWNGA
jgi:hypothetical protein